MSSKHNGNLPSPEAIDAIVRKIIPLLAGQHPTVQGGVLADLMAIYLAGHQGEGAEALREELLALHVATVRQLIPVNEALMRGEL
jgi:hypothetical protein